MSIGGSFNGEFRAATGLFASYNGEWVEVPLGGGGGPVKLDLTYGAPAAPAEFTAYTPPGVQNHSVPNRVTVDVPAGALPIEWQFGGTAGVLVTPTIPAMFGDSFELRLKGVTVKIPKPLEAPAAWTAAAATYGMTDADFWLYSYGASPGGIESLPNTAIVDLGNGWSGQWRSNVFYVLVRPENLRPGAAGWPLQVTVPDRTVRVAATSDSGISFSLSLNYGGWGDYGMAAPAAVGALEWGPLDASQVEIWKLP